MRVLGLRRACPWRREGGLFSRSFLGGRQSREARVRGNFDGVGEGEEVVPGAGLAGENDVAGLGILADEHFRRGEAEIRRQTNGLAAAGLEKLGNFAHGTPPRGFRARPALDIYHGYITRTLKTSGGAIHAPGKAASLAPEVLEEAEVFAEAEGADAVLEGGATAVEEVLKKRFELERAGNVLFDFDEFPGGEFFPARADGGVVAEGAEEEFDFGEGEAHVRGEADEEDAMEGVAGIAALADDPLGRGGEAHFFVVAGGGGVAAGAGGKFTDFHDGVPEILLDLKLTLTSSIERWDVANPIWRKAMNSKKEQFGKVSKRRAVATAGAALALLMAGGG